MVMEKIEILIIEGGVAARTCILRNVQNFPWAMCEIMHEQL